MSGVRTLRLGTRGSTLARTQSGLVADLLRAAGAEVGIVEIVTAGDPRPPDTAWGEGAFVTAIERALLDGTVDVAVHSAKDVPIRPDGDLVIAAYPRRAEPGDALVLAPGQIASSLDDLAPGAVIGTDSPRRTGFLLAARPDLRIVPLHGNVDTRLARLDAGRVDALVLAVAGLERLGRSDRIAVRLDPEVVPPAPGQGALAVQVRGMDADARSVVAALDDPATRLAVTAERALLEATGGGCRAPIGALASVSQAAGRHDIVLFAAVVEPDGTHRRTVRRAFAADRTLDAARDAAAELMRGRAPVTASTVPAEGAPA